MRGGSLRVFLALAVCAAVMLLATGTAAAAGPLIVIDPGHSGTSLTTIDPETQIRDEEYNNGLENYDAWKVAVILQAKLEAAGYSVLLTKDGPEDTVCKRDRANVANNNGAALAVSLHTSGHIFGQYGQIYVQRLDGYRDNIYSQRYFFNLPGVASLSQKFGNIFLAERRKIEGPSVVVTVNSWFGGRGLAPGNLPLVQLFSKVPWIYIEAGVPQSDRDRERYAQSMFNSIAACIPLDYVTPPLDTTPHRVRYDSTDSRLYYAGTWSTLLASGSFGSGYKYSSSGAVTVSFNGTFFSWIATTGTTFGKAHVSLDGALPQTVDLYRSSTARQQAVYTRSFATAGPHTVRIWRDPADAGTGRIDIDAVDVVGTLLKAYTSINPFLSATRYQEYSQLLSYTTDWKPVISPSYVQSAIRTTSSPRPLSFSFFGTGFRLIAAKAPGYGKLKVTIDGVVQSTYPDLYASTPTGRAIVYSRTALSCVTHKVVLDWSGQTNPSATGSVVNLDAIDVIGTLLPACTRYQETSSRLYYSAPWSKIFSTSYSDNYIRAKNANAPLTFKFSGTGFRIIAAKGPGYGKLLVTVDGKQESTYPDLYSATTRYRMPVYTRTGMAYGTHTVTIDWTGQMNEDALRATVNLDAVDIYGTLVQAP